MVDSKELKNMLNQVSGCSALQEFAEKEGEHLKSITSQLSNAVNGSAIQDYIEEVSEPTPETNQYERSRKARPPSLFPTMADHLLEIEKENEREREVEHEKDKAFARRQGEEEARAAIQREKIRGVSVPTGKSGRQIQRILDIAKESGFDVMEIPYGGKAAIKAKCLEDASLFSKSSFKHAWDNASSKEMLSMADKTKYTK